MSLGSTWMLSWRSGLSSSTGTDTTAVNTSFTLRHFRLALAAFFALLGVGALLFALVLHESALQSLYRSTVTVSLTGIDTKPDNAGGEVVTIVLILGGMAVYGYLVSAIVELIANGVLTGTVSER